MGSLTKLSVPGNFRRAAAALGLLIAFGVAGCGGSKKSETSTAEQKTFASPDEAGKALLAASQAGDQVTLIQILGPGSKAVVVSDDPKADAEELKAFVEKYNKMNRWATLGDGTQILYIGADNYPFPVRLKKDASARWEFDSGTAADEILTRTIGRNELLAIDAVSSVANAQELYFKTAHDGNAAHVYAQQVLSSAGKQDGLYWPVAAGQPVSPLGKVEEFAAEAVAAAGSGKQPEFDGYYIRILTAQGDKAKGGAKSYLVNGKLTGGFAVLAYPVKYGQTGIMTFLLSREGVMYERDLGAKTGEAAATITAYNPTDEWFVAE